MNWDNFNQNINKELTGIEVTPVDKSNRCLSCGKPCEYSYCGSECTEADRIKRGWKYGDTSSRDYASNSGHVWKAPTEEDRKAFDILKRQTREPYEDCLKDGEYFGEEK